MVCVPIVFLLSWSGSQKCATEVPPTHTTFDKDAKLLKKHLGKYPYLLSFLFFFLPRVRTLIWRGDVAILTVDVRKYDKC